MQTILNIFYLLIHLATACLIAVALIEPGLLTVQTRYGPLSAPAIALTAYALTSLLTWFRPRSPRRALEPY